MNITRILSLASIAFAAPASAADWMLVWSDEFNTNGLPDATKWTYEEGFVRNNEKQYYTKRRAENARVENGILVIESRREKFKNAGYQAGARSGSKSIEFAEYTSASLTTCGLHAWTYGKVEVRAKLPGGRGTWPAIWMLGGENGAGWPACGEIDIMEFVGHEPGVIHGTVHTAKYNHVKGTQKGGKVTVNDPDREFHVYSAEWTPERIDFLVDGKKYFSFANEKTGTEAWPFDNPHYLILNTAVGGAWGGAKGIDDTIFPTRFFIDYVRVYQQAGMPAQ
jgi:beta-glucanase (GH16 family)